MLIIDKYSRRPIYQQLIDGMEKEILSGVLRAGDQIPSVRELAVQLCINPNTVQKALAELDHAGVIISVQARGSFVASDAAEKIALRSAPRLEELSGLVYRLAAAGVDEELLITTVNNAINKVKNEKEENV